MQLWDYKKLEQEIIENVKVRHRMYYYLIFVFLFGFYSVQQSSDINFLFIQTPWELYEVFAGIKIFEFLIIFFGIIYCNKALKKERKKDFSKIFVTIGTPIWIRAFVLKLAIILVIFIINWMVSEGMSHAFHIIASISVGLVATIYFFYMMRRSLETISAGRA